MDNNTYILFIQEQINNKKHTINMELKPAIH